MQKKYLLILGLLLIFITGCKVSPFNVKAEVNYVSQEVKGDTTAAKKIEITVSLGNSVYIDSIKEVNATVNGTAVKLKFDNNEINDTNKKITIYAFVKADGVSIAPTTTNIIKIDSITMQDENDNEVTMKGTVPEIKITEGSSGTGTEGTLTAVSGLSATLQDDEIKVTWTADSNALQGYKVYRMEADGTNPVFNPASEVEVGTMSNIEYIDSNIVPDKVYFYRVTALRTSTIATPKQSIPVNAKYSVSIGKVSNVSKGKSVGVDESTITWDTPTVANSELVGYNIYLTDTTGVGEILYKLNNSQNPNIGKLNSYTITKSMEFGTGFYLTSGKDRYVRLAAVVKAGTVLKEGPKSDPVKLEIYDSTVTIIQNAKDITVSPYGNDSVEQGNFGVYVAWPAKASKYILERSFDAKEFTEIYRGTLTNYIDSRFLENKVISGDTTGYYRVRCIDVEGKIGLPSAVARITDYAEEDAPDISTADSNLTATLSAGNFTFAYKKADATDVTPTHLNDFAGYKIYMSTVYDGKYVLVGKVDDLRGGIITAAQLTAAGISTANQVWVRVSIYDLFGNEGNLSLRRRIK